MAAKTWNDVATACNVAAGWRLSSVKVMTHFSKPDEVSLNWPASSNKSSDLEEENDGESSEA